MMTKKRYDRGDKVKVVDAQPLGSGGHYENGDVFEVDYVNEYEDGDIIHTTTRVRNGIEGIQLYGEEVVPYEEEEEFDQATEIAKSLLQAIEDKQEVEHDVITSPSHYANSAIEPIEYMADKLPAFDDGFTAFCAGNVLKYVSRAPHKHETPLEDLKKARQYLDFAIEHEEKKRK